MNTVKCVICSQEVSKRQTLHIGGGKRACRSHETTANESAKVQANDKEQRQKQLEKLAKPFKHRSIREISVEIVPTCAVCRGPGLRQDEWHSRLMIEWQKYEIVHNKPHNIFDLNECREAAGSLAGTECLWYVEWADYNKKAKLPYNLFQFAEMFGLFLACTKCCKERGLTTYTQKQNESLTFEHLNNWALVTDLIKPAIREVAAKEMARDN